MTDFFFFFGRLVLNKTQSKLKLDQNRENVKNVPFKVKEVKKHFWTMKNSAQNLNDVAFFENQSETEVIILTVVKEIINKT